MPRWTRAAMLWMFLVLPVVAQDLEVEEILLDNGMKILVVERHYVPRVFCALFFRVGSVNERPGKTGVSHMLEHMMFKGTRTVGVVDWVRDAEAMAAIDRTMERIFEVERKVRKLALRGEVLSEEEQAKLKELRAEFQMRVAAEKEFIRPEELWNLYMSHGGTMLNAATGYDSTQYFVELPSNKIELFFWLESDRIRDPVFREFYSERDVVKEERRMRTDSTPTGRIEEAFEAMFWQASPYSWPIIGWECDLDNLTRQDALDYFRTNYAPNNAVALFIGDVDPEHVKELANRYFASLPRGPQDPPQVVTVEPETIAERRMVGEADAPDEVNVYFPGLPMGHSDSYPLDVLCEVLSGDSGRLHRAIIEGQKLALSTSVYQDNRLYGGSIMLGGRPRGGENPVSLQTLEDALLAEVEAIASGERPPTEEELLKVKNQYEAGFVRGLRSNIGIAFILGQSELGGDWRESLRILDKVRAVTSDDVVRAAREYIRPEKKSVLWVRRRAGAEGAAEESEEAQQVHQGMAMLRAQWDQIRRNPQMVENVLMQVRGMMGQISDPDLRAEVEAFVAELEASLEPATVPEPEPARDGEEEK